MHTLFALMVITSTVVSSLELPKCLSQFDYDQKLLYKLLKIEEEVNNFRIFIDEMKKRQSQTERKLKQKMAGVLENAKTASEEQLQDATEKSGDLLNNMKELMGNLSERTKKLQSNSAIGFSLKDPTPGPASGELTFKTVITNAGNGFNETTGRFTCNDPGYYFLSASLLTHYDHSGSTYCWIERNNDGLVVAFVQSNGSFSQGIYPAVNSVFVHLDKGDIVQLAACVETSSLDTDSTFSGFLVTAD